MCRCVLALLLMPGLVGRLAGQDTQVKLHSGKDVVNAHLSRPDRPGSFPGLLLLHGDFGLTPWVKEQARALAKKGYVALAVDLYRGELPGNIEEAHILERAVPEDRVLRDVRAAVDFLARRPDVQKERLGILGWEMGGGYALEGAIHDSRLSAAVICYGRLVTDSQRLAKLHGSVLGIFAEQDQGLSADTLKRFQAAMKKAGKRLAGLHVLPGTASGFMDPDSPYRDGPPARAATAQAWRQMDDYLSAELKGAKK